jgi:TP901 family phage tail tape measure protein
VAGKTEFPLSIVIRAIDKATAGFRSVVQRATKHAKAIEKVGKTLSVSLTAPIAAIGAASVRAATTFEQGMSNVSTLIDTSTESLEEMGKTVLAIGGRTPVAIDDLTGALYNLRSAGIGAADQMLHLERSAQLGVAGLGTTAEAVDIATSSINAFQLKGAEAQRVYDLVFRTVKAGKTNISELSNGFGGTAALVAASGTELDEFLALTAALTGPGLKASEAFTGIKNVVNGLTRTTDKSRAVFNKLGAKDLPDLVKKSGGLVQALRRIDTVIKGNKSAWLDLQVGSEGLNAILSALGSQGDAFANTLDGMRDKTVELDGAFAKQNATMAASVQRTKNALTSMGVSIGTVLAPAMESLASMLQSLAAWWGSLERSTQKWIVAIGVVVAAIGPALIIFAKVILALGAMKKAFLVVFFAMKTAILTIKAFSVALFASPIGWVILGIVALVAAGYLLITNWDKVKLFLVSMWEVVTEAFAAFLDWLKFAFFNFSPLGLVIQHWEPIKGFFAELWLGVTEVFEAAWRIIEDIVSKIVGVVDTVTGAIDTVSSAVSDVGGAIGSFFGGDDEDAGPDVAAGAGATIGGERLGRLAAAGTSASSAAVSVQFANTPRGTRVESDRRNTASVDLAVGYQLGGL